MRFNDRDNAGPGQLDFVPRARRNQIWKIVVAFVIAVTMILLLGSMADTGHGAAAMFLSILLVVVICFYVIYRRQQSLDLVMNAEYQNLLLTQAVALGSSFTMFVRRDGTIVYANEGLRALFPKFDYTTAQALEGLFAQSGVSTPDRERVMNAIYGNRSDRLIFPIRTPGKEQDYILTIEPIARPGGFSLVRGREYIGQRAGVQLLPDVLRSTSADKLDHLLAHTPTAHYTTDAYGKLEYVNPAFERLFGYAPGAMIEAKLSIQQLITQLNGQPLAEDYSISDFAGEVTFHVSGQVFSNPFRQTVMRDESGRVVGATGSILQLRA